MLNLSTEVLDELLKDYNGPQDLIGENGILKQLTKALVERCMSGEIDAQMQSEQGSRADEGNPKWEHVTLAMSNYTH